MEARGSIQLRHRQSFTDPKNQKTDRRHMAFNHTFTSNSKTKDISAKLLKFDAFRFKYESAQHYIEDRMNMDLARLKKNPKNLLD